MQLTVAELVRYTGEERVRWEKWFRENGDHLLKMPLTGDREKTIGALILHIFGPELRFVQRIRGEPLTEYRERPSRTVEEVFGFGIETRQALNAFLAGAKADDWSRVVDFPISGRGNCRATVRKAILHSLIHEIRHWAQISRIMRERGFAPPGEHDLLWSAALE